MSCCQSFVVIFKMDPQNIWLYPFFCQHWEVLLSTWQTILGNVCFLSPVPLLSYQPTAQTSLTPSSMLSCLWTRLYCPWTHLSFSPEVYTSHKRGLYLTFLSLLNLGPWKKHYWNICASCVATLPSASLGLLSGKHGCVIYWRETSASKEAQVVLRNHSLSLLASVHPRLPLGISDSQLLLFSRKCAVALNIKKS